MNHLCFVTDELFPFTKGGIGNLIYGLVTILSEKKKHHISIILTSTLTKNDLKKVSYHENVKLYLLDQINIKSDKYNDIPSWAFQCDEYYLSYKICNALIELNSIKPINLVEFNDYLGLGYITIKYKKLFKLSPFNNIKVVVRIHGTQKICLFHDDGNIYSKKSLLISYFEKYCLKYADHVLSPSTNISKYYKKFYELDILNSIISPPTFTRIDCIKHKRKIVIDNTLENKILFYGKIQKLKGIEEFIEAGILLLKNTSINFSFEIVGHEVRHLSGSSYISYLKNLIPSELQKKFNFKGRVQIESLPKIVEKFDLVVLPSKFETFCLSAHELNSSGIPIILNKIDAFTEYFKEDECYYFDGSGSHLYETINEIYINDKKINKKWNYYELLNKLETNNYSSVYSALLNSPISFTETITTPLVSVIIPYYNLEKYIDETIHSILSSTFKNYEVILVNDGSTTEAANEKFNALKQEYNYPNFFYYTKPNGGLGSARNFGVLKSKGKYCLPLDADDIIHKNYIEFAVNALEKNNELVAVNSFVNYFIDGFKPNEISDYVIPYDLNPNLILLENGAGIACSLLRKEILVNHPYNENLSAYEDWELWWRLSFFKYQVEALPVLLYHYRKRKNSLVNTEGYQKHLFQIRSISNINKHILFERCTELYNILYSQYYNSLYFHSLKSDNDTADESEQFDLVKHSDFQKMKDWYWHEYEVLPLWFKRLGHVIKILTGKRKFKSLYKKKIIN